MSEQKADSMNKRSAPVISRVRQKCVKDVSVSDDMTPDEQAEASMIGELYPRIIEADRRCESFGLEMHALEALQTPTAKALKRGLFTDLAWRRAFLAIDAAKRIRDVGIANHGRSVGRRRSVSKKVSNNE